MKRLTIALTAVVLTAAQAALAQPPAGGPPGGNPVDRLTQELSLTPAQKDKVTAIFDEQRKKREADRAANPNPTPDQRRAAFQASQQDLLDKLGGVLTPDQLAKYKEIQAQRPQRPPQPQ
jgi:Spy/CpxP family protein refolding chaperone